MLTIEQTSLSYTDEGGSQSITLAANKPWKATSNQSWCKVSHSGGEKTYGTSVEIICEANTTYDSRICTITFVSDEIVKSILIYQDGKPEILVATTDYNLSSEAQTLSIEVQTNVLYTVRILDAVNWITIISSKGMPSSRVILEVAENNTFSDRQVTIWIEESASGKMIPMKRIITIHQRQNDSLSVSPMQFSLTGQKQTIITEVISNVEFEVIPESNWIHHVETKSLSTYKVLLEIDENNTSETREGEVTIKQNNGNILETIEIIQQPAYIPVSSISLNNAEVSLYADETIQLIATVLPDNATEKTITWTSSTPSVAIVSETGLVSAAGKIGEATITAKAEDKTASCIIRVKERPSVSSITMNQSGFNAYINRYYNITAEVSPADAMGEFEWTITNDRIAEKIVSGMTGGQASLQIFTIDFGSSDILLTDKLSGKSASINISTVVMDFVWTESTSETYAGFPLITISVGESRQLKYSCSPSSATHIFEDLTNFIFYEPNSVVEQPSIISIDTEGKVTGLKEGIIGIKPTGRILKGSGSDRLYIRVVKDTYESVDLGLSVKWAAYNYGAASASDIGSYLLWGDVNGTGICMQFSSPNVNSISGTQYDIVHRNWGGNWRIPTESEIRELYTKCRMERITHHGVEVIKVTGPNGNSIVLPFTGCLFPASGPVGTTQLVSPNYVFMMSGDSYYSDYGRFVYIYSFTETCNVESTSYLSNAAKFPIRPVK